MFLNEITFRSCSGKGKGKIKHEAYQSQLKQPTDSVVTYIHKFAELISSPWFRSVENNILKHDFCNFFICGAMDYVLENRFPIICTEQEIHFPNGNSDSWLEQQT